jgi:hypothetical protein
MRCPHCGKAVRYGAAPTSTPCNALKDKQSFWQQELQRLLAAGSAPLEKILKLATELGIQLEDKNG